MRPRARPGPAVEAEGRGRGRGASGALSEAWAAVPSLVTLKQQLLGLRRARQWWGGTYQTGGPAGKGVGVSVSVPAQLFAQHDT